MGKRKKKKPRKSAEQVAVIITILAGITEIIANLIQIFQS